MVGPWVGHEHGLFIESERVVGVETVKDLIDYETMEWKTDLIDHYFSETGKNIHHLHSTCFSCRER